MFAHSEKGLYFYLSDKNDGHVDYYVDKNWKVGTKYSLKTVLKDGGLKIYYNGQLNQDISNSNIHRSSLYFKAGDYCQSDLTKSYDGKHESSSEYCNVLIHNITISHV